MSLELLQRAFQAHVTTGGNAIAGLVTRRGQRGLPVYHYAYRATLRATLADTFEKTRLWLGEDAFDAEADAYVVAHASRSWTLGDYGATFGDFLGTRHPGDPEVAELAWLDWSLRRAFGAAAAPDLDRETLAAIDWDEARIEFAAHVAVRDVSTNVAAVWNSLPETPIASDVLASPVGLIVWREDLSPQFRSTVPAESALIGALKRNSRFGVACDSVASQYAISADEIGAFLGTWLKDGLLARVAA